MSYMQKNNRVSGNGSENLGRIGTDIFFTYFFSGKNYNFTHFEM